MNATLRRLARRLPYLRDLHRYLKALEAERDQLRAAVRNATAELEALRTTTFVLPGHYYSPIPAIHEIREREGELFGEPPRTLPAIDLREAEQLALLGELSRFYAELPFPRQQSAHTRYWYDNDWYSYTDAIFLYSMLRHLRPGRVIEIGSGFSSAVMLDTAESFLDNGVALTFIEPDPEARLTQLVRPADRAEIVRARLQDVPLARFAQLGAGDILLVDSTHISKTGSDVNLILHEILPRLASGVYVHFHDIFYPFEYPKPWVYEGRAWNEDYILRAFLEYNDAFEIVLFSTFLIHFHRDWFAREMPLCLDNPGGNLWLRKR